jgi:hypothetical protein
MGEREVVVTTKPKPASPRTLLSPERWATLLSIAKALGFRLPGPRRGRTVDQLHVFWQRAVRSSTVPDEELWGPVGGKAILECKFWYTWPASHTDLLNSDPPEVQYAARSVRLVELRWPSRDERQMEVFVVLLHSVLAARAAAGEGPEPPVELVAEVSRVLASGCVLAQSGTRWPR